MKIETPMDFAEAIAKHLGWPKAKIEEFFDFGETKDGLFFAALQAGKWLKDTQDFKALCNLARDLGGKYVEGERLWQIPGPGFKTEQPAQSMPLPGGEAIPIVKQEPAPSQPEEKAPIPEGEDETAFLRSTAERVGHLTPILRDRSGEIIDGVHRLQADPSWISQTVYDIDKREDPVKFQLARLIVNVCRRQVNAEEKTEILGEIAKLTNWSQRRISEETGMSLGWVNKYLPTEYKKPEPEELERSRREREEPEYIKHEIEEPGTQERRTAEQPSTESVPEPRRAEVTDAKPEAIDTGLGITCGECNQTFTLIHVARNLHRLQKITVTEATS